MQEGHRIIYATTTSELKLGVLREYFENHTVVSYIDNTFDLPEQPINEYGIMCAKMRMSSIQHEQKNIVSIESYIVEDSSSRLISENTAVIMRTDDGSIYSSVHVYEPSDHYKSLYNDYVATAVKTWGGYCGTFGDYLFKHGHTTDAKNWHGFRKNHITTALESMKTEGTHMDAYVDYYRDFPKPGVIFASMDSLMAHPRNFRACITDLFTKHDIMELGIDYVIGLETRGIALGAIMATCMRVGFQIARKAGKLPQKNLMSTAYSTEYSKDVMELAPLPGGANITKILIVDDVIATGGSMCAVAECIRSSTFGTDGTNCNYMIYCFAPIVVYPLRPEAKARFEASNINWIH
jgi:adenine phosphoribosyltransferase